jgi:lysophospholipase L1-like esterase
VWDPARDVALCDRGGFDGPVARHGVVDGSRRPRAALTVLLAVVAVAALVTVVVQARHDDDPDVYVSIGDSYGAGFRPTDGGTATTRDGFAYQVADRAAAAGRPLLLLNFACTGATSGDVVGRAGCPEHYEGPGGQEYRSSTQADAAVAAMQEHRGHVRLVTIVIGGNDVINCLPATRDAIPPASAACLDTALATLAVNLRALLTRVRAALGPDVPVVGLTYPDVFLGGYVFDDAAARSFAGGSVALFRDRLNPALRAAYAAAGAPFLDVTALTGGYDPLDRTVDEPPYGRVPEPVARVCELTFYCSRKDLHPTRAGHTLIAEAILRVVPLATS